MRYLTSIDDAVICKKSVVTLGKFDGLHRGHRQLVENLKVMKEQYGPDCETAAFTFTRELLKWKFGSQFKCILEENERKELFEQMGVDLLVECPFDEKIRNMEACDFVKDILVGKLGARAIVIGRDFRFGYERKGDYELLKRLEAVYGFSVELIGEVYEEDFRISSTRIREEISKGEMEAANRMLGYPFTVEGEILHGKELGRTIDMPTINLIPSVNKLLPPFGVYASVTEMEGKAYPGVTNIGKKPTVGEFAVGVETHLFDVKGDFYGKQAKVHLYHFMRPEQKFSSVEELKAQMHRDGDQARVILASII